MKEIYCNEAPQGARIRQYEEIHGKTETEPAEHKKKKFGIKNAILITIEIIALVVCCVSVCCMDNNSWIPVLAFAFSMAWLMLFAWANTDFFLED